MSDGGNKYKWMLAGSMLGMMGVYAGQSMMHNTHKSGHSHKVSTTASRMTKDAGEFISAVGDTMLHRTK